MSTSQIQAASFAVAGSVGNVSIGISSWSDRSLTHESDWYPKRSMKAAERIAFYATQFPITEIETTYRFPPTPDVAHQWAERTPDGFKYDIQVWSLLTQQPTMPASLWDDLSNEVQPEKRDNPKLYATHLSNDALNECWHRFVHAVTPLADTGKLGALILRFPKWFVPRDRNRDVLEQTRYYLGDLPAAIELHCPEWFEASECEKTFDVLEDLDFAFVCVDGHPDDPRSANSAGATTNDLGILRLRGRRSIDEDYWHQDWRNYEYDQDELSQIARRTAHLAGSSEQTHVLVSTCWRDCAVRNAEHLARLLRKDDELVIDLR